MVRLEGESNHRLEFINEIFYFHVINSSSARSFIPTPKKLTDKKMIINPQNKDDKCFLYAIGMSVFSDELDNKNLEKISKKNFKCEQLNIDNINFPPSLKDTEQFEKDYPDGFSLWFSQNKRR